MSNFFINIFLINILIDPVNSLLHTKIITFLLCMITNVKRIQVSFDRIAIFFIFYIAFFLSVVIMLLRNIQYDVDFLKMYATTFLTLAIFFINPARINIMPGLKIATVFIAGTTIFFGVLTSFFPAANILFLLDNGLGGIFTLAVPRKILYWQSYSVFHRASPILVFPLALIWYQYLKTRRNKYFICVSLLFLTLFFSGTRANIFSGILIICLIYTHYIYFTKKRMLHAVFLVSVVGSLFVIGTFLLLTVRDTSSVAKEGHLFSYIELFYNNIDYFLFGQGPGSYFYTSGFNRVTTNTELSYLELIRMFGIFFAILIVFVYILPFLKERKYNLTFNFSIAIAYLAYLFIAGTNPLLIGPTGFMAMWIAYVFFAQSNNKRRNNDRYINGNI